jgi:hypothetical protein
MAVRVCRDLICQVMAAEDPAQTFDPSLLARRGRPVRSRCVPTDLRKEVVRVGRDETSDRYRLSGISTVDVLPRRCLHSAWHHVSHTWLKLVSSANLLSPRYVVSSQCFLSRFDFFQSPMINTTIAAAAEKVFMVRSRMYRLCGTHASFRLRCARRTRTSRPRLP